MSGEEPAGMTVAARAIVAAALSGHDLGTPVRLIDPKTKRLVLGDLTGIEHARGYGRDRPLRVMLTVEADGWRWYGHLDGDAMVNVDVQAEHERATGQVP